MLNFFYHEYFEHRGFIDKETGKEISLKTAASLPPNRLIDTSVKRKKLKEWEDYRMDFYNFKYSLKLWLARWIMPNTCSCIDMDGLWGAWDGLSEEQINKLSRNKILQMISDVTLAGTYQGSRKIK